MATLPVPKCPGCGQILNPRTDILCDNAGTRLPGFWAGLFGFQGTSFVYCGFCGVVLGGATNLRTFTKTKRG